MNERTSSSPARLSPAAALLVVAVAIGCYANSLGCGLVLDDLNAIVGNPAVRDLDVRAILTTPSWFGNPVAVYRPVTTLSFALDHAFHRLDPFGYHLVNVVLHAAVSLLAAGVVLDVTRDVSLALVSALLFATHPVHTEAVTSVVGRAEELAALFGLAAWLVFLGGGHTRSRAAIAAVLVLLSALSKESGVTFVGAIGAAAVLGAGHRGTSPGRSWGAWVALGATAVIAIVLRAIVVGGVDTPADRLDNVAAAAPLLPRLLTAVGVLGRYALVLVWPWRLAADHSYPQIPLVVSALDPVFMAGAGVVAVAAGLAAWGWRHGRAVTFAIAFAAVTLFVTANLLVPIGTIMAERLLYVPSLGFCLLAAIAIQRGAARSARGPRPLVIALAAFLTLGYAARTVARNRVWRDPRTFAEALVRDAPESARSHRELALVLGHAGDTERARAEIRTALALDPHNAVTLYDLGNIELTARRYDEAMAAYRAALDERPDHVESMINLGNVESTRGDEAAAEGWFRRALAVAPDSTGARVNLANALLRQSRPAEAAREYESAVALSPADAGIRFNHAVCLEQLGRFSEAVAEYRVAVSRAPDAAAAAVRLVAALVAAGRVDEARAEQARAEARFPDDPGVAQTRALLAGAPATP